MPKRKEYSKVEAWERLCAECQVAQSAANKIGPHAGKAVATLTDGLKSGFDEGYCSAEESSNAARWLLVALISLSH